MDQKEYYNLLIKYLDGEANAEEVLIVEELLHTDSSWKNEFEILKKITHHIPKSVNYSINAKTDAGWEALKLKIESKKPVKTFKLWPSVARYAAAATIILVAGWFLLKPAKNEFSSFDSGKVYKTGSNEITIVKLNDGSKITLNENSVLTIDKNFNQSARLIKLEGEAYFEVAKNDGKPFIASAKNTMTKVLGTVFEIESTNKNQVTVTLFDGRIEFSSATEDQILAPGEKLNYSLKNKTIEKENVGSLDKDSWVNSLSFKDTKLEDITEKLETQYKISISVPSNKQSEQYTVSFEGLDLPSSLRLLEELTDSKITKKDSDYILNP